MEAQGKQEYDTGPRQDIDPIGGFHMPPAFFERERRIGDMIACLEHAPFTAQPIDHRKDMHPAQDIQFIGHQKFHGIPPLYCL